MQVIVFADAAHADAAARWAHAASARLVRKESSDYDDLLAIAQHGAVEPVVVVALDGDECRLRLARLVDHDVFRQYLEQARERSA